MIYQASKYISRSAAVVFTDVKYGAIEKESEGISCTALAAK